jgi:hypothetical protein
MNQKYRLKLHIASAAILLFISCDKELENCTETVCFGPNSTDCFERPITDSGCFPDNPGF